MSKKYSKQIIQEAIQSAIDNEIILEGPINFAKSVGGGVKGAFQGMGGNYRANRARSYMTQLGNKTQKVFDKLGPKAVQQARKMQQSSNSAVKQTGEKIEDEVADTGERVKDLKSDIESSFPAGLDVGSAQGGMKDPGSSRRGPIQKNDPTVGFYKWLDTTHGINSDNFHHLGKGAQDELVHNYLTAAAQHKIKGAKQQQLKQKLSQGLAQDEQEVEQTGKVQNVPAPFPKPASPESKADTVPQVQRRDRGAQPPRQQPSLRAPVVDIIANKPLRLSPTDQRGVPPEVAKRMPPQPQPVSAQPQKPVSKTFSALPQSQQGPPAQKPIAPTRSQQLGPVGSPSKIQTRPVQQPLTLKDVGATQDEIKHLSSLKSNDPIVQKLEDELRNALSAGWADVARAKIDAIKNQTRKTDTNTGSNSTKALKKKQLTMPPEKDFSTQMGKALKKSAPKPEIPKVPDRKTVPFTKTEPMKVADEEPRKEKSTKAVKKKKPSAKRKSKKEEQDPVMSMADFMKSSENDPEQKRQAREKIKASKQNRKSKNRGKKLLIQEK